ncbi:hypothetical protein KP509_16G080100 [Ceratopteris richardii]|uniref:Uncharacterized protein n=1 Tax=Ceratopteris richardii TaxID=49495 RepID=A0A8T2T3Z3_CERRI|nr:hypothetical protein KP509_16G080100 [Ceratopteris richardii]
MKLTPLLIWIIRKLDCLWPFKGSSSSFQEIESSEGDDSEVCLIDPTHVEPDNRASKCNLPSKSTTKIGQQDLGEAS